MIPGSLYPVNHFTSKNWWIFLTVFIASVLTGIATVVYFVMQDFADREADISNAPLPKYMAGDLVRSRVGNHPGMVIRSSCRASTGCRYSVRFDFAETRTDVALFGRDGPIRSTPLTEIGVYEFEIERQ